MGFIGREKERGRGIGLTVCFCLKQNIQIEGGGGRGVATVLLTTKCLNISHENGRVEFGTGMSR